MKNFLIFLSISFFVFNFSNSEEIKIAYVDVDRILNNSNVGKEIKLKLDNLSKKKASNFKKIEKQLKETEKKISQQQNILSKEEFQKKVRELQEKGNNFQKDVRKSKNEIITTNRKATSEILTLLNKILANFASENSISIILQKKNIVIGKADLEITDEVMEIFNKKVKKIELN